MRGRDASGLVNERWWKMRGGGREDGDIVVEIW